MTVPIFLEHVRRLRPVWTITWRDITSPSLRSGVPKVKEADIWHNKQIAHEYLEKCGTTHFEAISTYISNTNEWVQYRVRHPYTSIWSVFTSTETVHTLEKTAMAYLFNLVTRILFKRY